MSTFASAPENTPNPSPELRFFAGDGEMGDLMRSFDWSRRRSVPRKWPQSLRTAVSILLTSRYQMWMAWGRDLTFLYNDAYRPTLGMKHPWALGDPGRRSLGRNLERYRPRDSKVIATGQATYDEGLLLLILKSGGFPEETYHTFSYSPLTDDAGDISGMFCVVTEETERIIGERRMALLRELASDLASSSTERRSDRRVRTASAAYSRRSSVYITYLFGRWRRKRPPCMYDRNRGGPSKPRL